MKIGEYEIKSSYITNVKGSDAGTSLKTMLMRLNPTTKEAYNQMRDLGLITYNAQAGYDFLVKNGIQPASRSVGDIEQALGATRFS
ncbi:phage tail tape measure protein, partial [Bacillus thuringiensis]|nr:phage tail tape measure protein [Bacillus thuringiensis]MEE2014371.1 phage tail tape measure protein [Bacillus thuringiensis]